MDMAIDSQRKIHLPFWFRGEEKGQNVTPDHYAVEKSENGVLRRYLTGVSSGVGVDGHGERMTRECVESMMRQGNDGDLKLYSGLHGVNFTDDIGIMTTVKILDNGDLYTEYRLYDDQDVNIQQKNRDTAQQVWAQINGLPPYSKPAKLGFSVEGIVNEKDILSRKIDKEGNSTHRVINNMILDGVVLVTRPAYQSSIASAVFKCLGELPPESEERIRAAYTESVQKALKTTAREKDFYEEFYEAGQILEENIFKFMRHRDQDRNKKRLEVLFDVYKSHMVDLISQNVEIFRNAEPVKMSSENANPLLEELYYRVSRMGSVFKNLYPEKYKTGE